MAEVRGGIEQHEGHFTAGDRSVSQHRSVGCPLYGSDSPSGWNSKSMLGIPLHASKHGRTDTYVLNSAIGLRINPPAREEISRLGEISYRGASRVTNGNEKPFAVGAQRPHRWGWSLHHLHHRSRRLLIGRLTVGDRGMCQQCHCKSDHQGIRSARCRMHDVRPRSCKCECQHSFGYADRPVREIVISVFRASSSFRILGAA